MTFYIWVLLALMPIVFTVCLILVFVKLNSEKKNKYNNANIVRTEGDFKKLEDDIKKLDGDVERLNSNKVTYSEIENIYDEIERVTGEIRRIDNENLIAKYQLLATEYSKKNSSPLFVIKPWMAIPAAVLGFILGYYFL